MENIQVGANEFGFEHIGWRYYNKIRKKAMEQEFSWSGLLISMSIAFFVVIITAFSLNFLYNSVNTTHIHKQLLNQKIYRLEAMNQQKLEYYLQINHLSQEKMEKVRSAYLA